MFSLEQYINEARQLEQQGEVVEAIWCYDTVLRDRFITDQMDMLREASLGLGKLLLSESLTSQDSIRTDRLIHRAIAVMIVADTHHPNDAVVGLLLAEIHERRYCLKQQAKDLLAAHMLLDTIPDRTIGVDEDLLRRSKTLRAKLAAH